MSPLKIILLCLAFILSACNPGSRSEERDPLAKTNNSKRTCIPESELMAANIVGGQLVVQNDDDAKLVMMLVSNGHMCTAAAIGKKVLLTAAHCIAGNKMNTFVSFYPSVSCESGYNKNLYVQGISETIVHEDYDSSKTADKMKGDIALVFLENDIPDGYTIHKIADPGKIFQDSSMFLYGYGKTGSKAGGAGMLRKTILNRALYDIILADKKIKIDQTSGSGICQGDSGGPVFVNNTEGEMQILGVNSYVVGPEQDICSKHSYQTLVHAYKDWIELKLSAKEKTLR